MGKLNLATTISTVSSIKTLNSLHFYSEYQYENSQRFEKNIYHFHTNAYTELQVIHLTKVERCMFCLFEMKNEMFHKW